MEYVDFSNKAKLAEKPKVTPEERAAVEQFLRERGATRLPTMVAEGAVPLRLLPSLNVADPH